MSRFAARMETSSDTTNTVLAAIVHMAEIASSGIFLETMSHSSDYEDVMKEDETESESESESEPDVEGEVEPMILDEKIYSEKEETTGHMDNELESLKPDVSNYKCENTSIEPTARPGKIDSNISHCPINLSQKEYAEQVTMDRANSDEGPANELNQNVDDKVLSGEDSQSSCVGKQVVKEEDVTEEGVYVSGTSKSVHEDNNEQTDRQMLLTNSSDASRKDQSCISDNNTHDCNDNLDDSDLKENNYESSFESDTEARMYTPSKKQHKFLREIDDLDQYLTYPAYTSVYNAFKKYQMKIKLLSKKVVAALDKITELHFLLDKAECGSPAVVVKQELTDG